jgi:hypothetical protein
MADDAAADDDDHAPPSALAPLPHAVVLSIFAQLPVDERARLALVCRGWRAALADPALWTRLDVSRTSGVTAAVTDALLRGAAARAGGALRVLDVSGCSRIWRAALRAVVTVHGGSLRELRVCHGVCADLHLNHLTGEVSLMLSLGDAESLLRAAPQLHVFDAAVDCDSVADARAALCAEGLLAPLRVRGLRMHNTDDDGEADFLALAADVASHAWLRQLCLRAAPPTPAALGALVDAALARRLAALQLDNCDLSAASAPALARLLRGGDALTELWLAGHAFGTDGALDAPAAAALAPALRANATLTTLHLAALRLWDDLAAAATLLGALAAHPSLRALSIRGSSVRHADRAAAGASLAALLAANAPALTELDVAFCNLGDDGLAPLLQALRANTHLRALACPVNDITEAFAADVLLPAVRASGSLRALSACHDDTWPDLGQDWAGALDAERFVNDRDAEEEAEEEEEEEAKEEDHPTPS